MRKSFRSHALLPRPLRRQPQHRDAQHGMALMEVVVSILIFSFGILGLIGLEASAINFSTDAEDRSRAALFASDIASTMWINGSVDVVGNPALSALYPVWQINIANPALPTGLPSGSKLNITPTAGTTNSADISITWTAPTDKAATAPLRQLTTRVILP